MLTGEKRAVSSIRAASRSLLIVSANRRLAAASRRPAAPSSASRSRQASRLRSGARSRKDGWNIGRVGTGASRPGTARSNQRPRSRVMPSLSGSSALAAVPPASTSTLGRASAIWRSTNGRQDGDLGRGRLAVAGRAPVDDVGDLHAAAVEADRRQHAVEQLPGAADKGLADAVLVGARRLADDHDRRGRVAVDEDGVGRGALQRAAVEAGDQRRQRLDRLGACAASARADCAASASDSAKRAGRRRPAVARGLRTRAGARRRGGATAGTAAAGRRRRQPVDARSRPIASSAPISICQCSSAARRRRSASREHREAASGSHRHLPSSG